MIVSARSVQMALAHNGLAVARTGVFDDATITALGDFIMHHVPGGGIEITQGAAEADISDKVLSALFAHDKRTAAMIWGALSITSGLASLYHGVKRNNGSVGWGLWWGLMGSTFPIVTPAIAVAQGYGKRRGGR